MLLHHSTPPGAAAAAASTPTIRICHSATCRRRRGAASHAGTPTAQPPARCSRVVMVAAQEASPPPTAPPPVLNKSPSGYPPGPPERPNGLIPTAPPNGAVANGAPSANGAASGLQRPPSLQPAPSSQAPPQQPARPGMQSLPGTSQPASLQRPAPLGTRPMAPPAPPGQWSPAGPPPTPGGPAPSPLRPPAQATPASGPAPPARPGAMPGAMPGPSSMPGAPSSMPGAAPPPRPGGISPPPPGLAARPTLAGPSRPSMTPTPMARPTAAAGAPGLMPPPTAAPPAPGSALLNRPMMRPTMPGATGPGMPLQRPMPPPPPPSGAPSAAAQTAGVRLIRPGSIPAPGPVPELKRPEPPPLRVLESLMPPPGSMPARLVLEEVVEEAEGVVDDEDREFLAKKPSGKGTNKRKGKVTAEMKRRAAAQRKEEREEKAASEKKEREEIFEVGDEGMSLEQLAEIVQVGPSELVRTLFMKGIMLSMNQVLDKNTCKLVAAEYGLLMVEKQEDLVSDQAKKTTEFVTDDDIDELVPRPPVVTVMGHVDHGKTSLLDYIRKARVAAGEAGGITQGIGAYNTTLEVDGEMKTICFLDTPGHEAFSAMRARGAKVTDVAIIIVAADDGVRPQTREAVSHAQAAGVPLVVAINKVDKPGADVERVKQELLELNLVAEEWGGSTPMVAVSAKKGQGVADLLQMVLWVAEEKQLMANPKKPAQGTVIEAHLDKRVGPVASLLVQAGTLRVGAAICAGGSCGKVRSMTNDLGQSMSEAGPSIALQLSGLDSVPDAGEEFLVYPSETEAREAAAAYMSRSRQQHLNDMTSGGSMVTLSSLASMDEDTEGIQRMNLVIKADTMGVVQAIKSALGALPQESVALRYLLSGAGMITLSDVDLAAASSALLVGFNLEPTDAVQLHAKRLGVTIMTYKVIYEIVDDIKAAMEGRLRAVQERVVLGKAEVKAVFGSGKKRVAGCVVTEGKVQKGALVSVMRGKKMVYEGKLVSLRRIKDTVDEVNEGTECGLSCGAEFLEWSEGDVIECFNFVSKSRKLEEAKASMAVDLSSLN